MHGEPQLRSGASSAAPAEFSGRGLRKVLKKRSVFFKITTLIISKKPGNTGISRDIRTEFTTDLLLSD